MIILIPPVKTADFTRPAQPAVGIEAGSGVCALFIQVGLYTVYALNLELGARHPYWTGLKPPLLPSKR
jgi:hypothetical protein